MTLDAGSRLGVYDIQTNPSFRFSNELLAATGFSAVTFSRDYDITPDGKRLLMVFLGEQQKADAGLFNVVLNWTEELKKVGADAK
jgi:hypothetical protein